MEGDTSKKWEGYIVRYLNNKVRINTNSLFTDGCELGANFSTDGSATIGKSLSVGGNATVDGTLMFYDLENQAKTSGKVKRQPVASVSADDSQVAYLFSGTGSKHGATATYRRLGIRAKWGGSGFSTDYLYTTSQVSDIRLKENIEASETDALETVNRMKVRQFDWKENVTNIQALISKASSGTCILFHLSGANYAGNDLPIGEKYKYGSGIIFYRNSNSCKIVLFPEEMKPVWKMANWAKWKDFANNIVD